MTQPEESPRFVVPLPGGRVARIPQQVLEQYVVEGEPPAHDHSTERSTEVPPTQAETPSSKQSVSVSGGPANITINIYAGPDGVRIGTDQGESDAAADDDDDVSAHGLSVDPVTGASVWHTDWELGWCSYTDESGFPQTTYAWHRHPLGNEYAELF